MKKQRSEPILHNVKTVQNNFFTDILEANNTLTSNLQKCNAVTNNNIEKVAYQVEKTLDDKFTDVYSTYKSTNSLKNKNQQINYIPNAKETSMKE